MATREHLRVDVLVPVAAAAEAVGLELVEIERLLHLDEAGAGRTCPGAGPSDARGDAAQVLSFKASIQA